MLVAAIIAGCLTWLSFTILAGPLFYGSHGAGVFPGFVAAAWLMWLAYLPVRRTRNKFLHPRPRSYQISRADAAFKIQECMDEGNVRFGEPWECALRDPQGGSLAYFMKWTEREVRGQSGHFVKVEERLVNLQRELYLEVKLLEKIAGYTIVQLHWFARAQDRKDACDHVIRATTADIMRALGPGVEVPKQATTWLQPPPVPLIAGTVVMLLILMIDVGRNISLDQLNSGARREKVAEAKQRFESQKTAMTDELKSWREYKEQNGIE